MLMLKVAMMSFLISLKFVVANVRPGCSLEKEIRAGKSLAF